MSPDPSLIPNSKSIYITNRKSFKLWLLNSDPYLIPNSKSIYIQVNLYYSQIFIRAIYTELQVSVQLSTPSQSKSSWTIDTKLGFSFWTLNPELKSKSIYI